MSGKISKIYLWKNFLKFFFDDNVLNRNFFENYFFLQKKFFESKSPHFLIKWIHLNRDSIPAIQGSATNDYAGTLAGTAMIKNEQRRLFAVPARFLSLFTCECSRAWTKAVPPWVVSMFQRDCSRVVVVAVPAWLFSSGCSRVVVLPHQPWLFQRVSFRCSRALQAAR